MTKIENLEYEKGSGNVFADLELDDADELFTRSQIGFHLYQILKEKKLKQKEIALLSVLRQKRKIN